MTERDPNQPANEAPTVAWTPPPDHVVEDATPATPAERVRPAPRGGRLRWGIALLVTVAIVAVGAAAIVLVTGQSSPSGVVGYAPADSVIYGEVRLDLPGDQRQKLGQFLAKFPGFQDQSTLEIKIDDVLDRAIKGLTSDRQDWTTKIKPWFGGQLGFGLGSLPTPEQPEEIRGLVVASVKDAAKAQAWIDEVTADLEKTTATHKGVDLSVFGEGGIKGAVAIHGGRALLVGDEASVRAAIDTGGQSGLASKPGFAQAQAAIQGDGLGSMYLDLKRYMDWATELMESVPGASAAPVGLGYLDLLPDWAVLRLQMRDGAVALESVVPHVPELNVVAGNRRGVLADHLPPSTFVLLDSHEAGATFRKMIELMKQDPASAEIVEQIEAGAGIVGGIDAIFGWMGDGGFALTREGSTVSGGLVIQPTDRARGQQLLTSLRSLIEIGGSDTGVTFRDEVHNGTTITVVSLPNPLGLAGMGGAGLPPGMPLGENVELAYAITDEIAVVGFGPAFVRQVLDAGAGASLAEDARYQALLEAVGTENTSAAFIDITAIREVVESLGAAQPEALATYEKDIKPYVLPLDALVQATVRDGDLDRTVTLLTVK